VLLAPSRSPAAIQETLAAVAARARAERATASASSFGVAPSTAAFASLLDTIVTRAVARPLPHPGLLLLVANGPALAPEELEQLAAARQGRQVPDALATATAQAARVLAAYGWRVIAAPILDRPPGTRRNVAAPPLAATIGPDGRPQYSSGFTWPLSRWKSLVLDEEAFAPYLDPPFAPLLTLVAQTAGRLAVFREQLEATVGNLGQRWHLAYRSPDPGLGRLVQLEVHSRRDGTSLRAPAWVRASTPEDLAAIRLRRLAAGALIPAETPDLHLGRGSDGSLAVTGVIRSATPPAASETRHVLRLAWACDGDLIRHPPTFEVIRAVTPTPQGFPCEASVAPAAACKRLLVLIDDLTAETWTAARLDLPAP